MNYHRGEFIFGAFANTVIILRSFGVFGATHGKSFSPWGGEHAASGVERRRSGCARQADPNRLPGTAPAGAVLHARRKRRPQPAGYGLSERILSAPGRLQTDAMGKSRTLLRRFSAAYAPYSG